VLGTSWPYPGTRRWKFDFHTHTSIIERLTLPDLTGVEQPVVRVEVARSLFVHHKRSEQLSGKRPEYRLNDDSELVLTIFAARAE
jgi:hypothetical protein